MNTMENIWENIDNETQKIWNGYFMDRMWHSSYNPVDLTFFRENDGKNTWNFNIYIPWIIKSCYGVCATFIEDIFILDEDAKEYLYKHAPELLEQYGGSEIQKYIKEKNNEVSTILQKAEKSWWVV